MDNTALAVMMRAMQWQCDDAAFRLGNDTLTIVELAQMEANLRSLADSVRRYIDQRGSTPISTATPLVIEGDSPRPTTSR